MRRQLSVLLVVAFLGSACTSNPPPEVLTVGSLAEPEREQPNEQPPLEPGEPLADPAAEEGGVPTEPPPTPTEVPPPPPIARLEAADVLLTEDAADEPWDLQHRATDVVRYEIGPVQSDCPDFWTVEQITSLATANALWWRDGGNLVHDVVPFDSTDHLDDVMAAAGGLTDNCPVVSWGEGGDTFVAPLALAFTTATDVRVVNLEFSTDTGDLRWVSFAARGNLLSVVTLVQWPVDGGYPVPNANEFAGVAALAARRLEAAGPERFASPTPTPPPTPTREHVLEQPPIDPLPTVEPSPAPEALTIAGFEVFSADVSEPDHQRVIPDDPACAALSALDRLDAWTTVDNSYLSVEGDTELEVVIAVAPSTTDAEEATQAVATFADCSVEHAIEVEQGTIESTPIDLPGFDAATRFVVTLDLEAPFGEDPDGNTIQPSIAVIAAIIASRGDRIVAVGLSGPEPLVDLEELQSIAEFVFASQD